MRNYKTLIVCLSLALSVLAVIYGIHRKAHSVAGPSFNCTFASRPVEKLICTTPELAALDRELARQFDSAITLPKVKSVELRNSEHIWVDERGQCAQAGSAEAVLACVRKAYEDRIAFLSDHEKLQEIKREAPVAMTVEDLESYLGPQMAQQMTENKVAGAVVAIVKDGQPFFAKGYGQADIANAIPMSAEQSLVRPGSISKLFTGIAVMQLVETGKLDLDRDVNDYLDFAIPTPDGGVPVTLRRSLTHRAGFEEHAKELFAKDGPSPLGPWLAQSLPPRLFPKGDVPAYSNYGMSLAGYIVERVSGEPFAGYVARHILAPLGMAHSSFQQPLPPDLAPLMAQGYRSSDLPPLGYFETITAAPAGALSSTAEDMGRFMAALLAGMKSDTVLLKRDSLLEMLRPQQSSALGSIGLVFYSTDIDGKSFVGHEGDVIAFHSALLLSPEDNFGMFLSFDGFGGVGIRASLPAKLVARYFTLPPESEAVNFVANPADAAAIAGTYESSRRSESTFLRVGALIQQLTVRDLGDGRTMVGSAFGNGSAQREIGQRVYENDFGGRMAFTSNAAGGTSIDLGPPILQYQSVPWYRAIGFVRPVVGISIVLLLRTVLFWPIGALIRKWRRRPFGNTVQDRRYFVLARSSALLQIITSAIVIAGLVFLQSDPSLLSPSLDPVLVIVYGVAWASVLASVIPVFVAIRFWKGKVGSLWQRVDHSVMALSSIALAWFFVVWRIAGVSVNY